MGCPFLNPIDLASVVDGLQGDLFDKTRETTSAFECLIGWYIATAFESQLVHVGLHVSSQLFLDGIVEITYLHGIA